MSLYGYKDKLFKSQDDVMEWIASNEQYIGEEGLMQLFEDKCYLIDDFNGILAFAKEQGYTVTELFEMYDLSMMDIGIPFK